MRPTAFTPRTDIHGGAVLALQMIELARRALFIMRDTRDLVYSDPAIYKRYLDGCLMDLPTNVQTVFRYGLALEDRGHFMNFIKNLSMY